MLTVSGYGAFDGKMFVTRSGTPSRAMALMTPTKPQTDAGVLMLQELKNLTRRVTALENQLNQLVRIGIVVQVLPDLGKVRCRLHDADCMETFELAVLFPKTRLDKYYAHAGYRRASALPVFAAQ